MATITLTYAEQVAPFTTYVVELDKFGSEDLPRSYGEGSGYTQSASGAPIVSGPSYNRKHIWAINTTLTVADAKNLNDMFKAWDRDRSTGVPSVIGIQDETLFDTINASAVFSTPPSFSMQGPAYYLVDMGLSEI